jgi:hypothetical protein
MSNLSPLTGDEGIITEGHRPLLPQLNTSALPTASADQSTRTAVPLDCTRLPTSSGIEIPQEDKIRAIIEEFGDVANLMQDEEPERILAESAGSLFK